MKARDIFGIIVRCVALWVIIWGAWQTLAAVAVLPATVQSYMGNEEVRYSSFTYLVYGLPTLIVGFLVLRFAEALVRFTYRD